MSHLTPYDQVECWPNTNSDTLGRQSPSESPLVAGPQLSGVEFLRGPACNPINAAMLRLPSNHDGRTGAKL